MHRACNNNIVPAKKDGLLTTEKWGNLAKRGGGGREIGARWASGIVISKIFIIIHSAAAAACSVVCIYLFTSCRARGQLVNGIVVEWSRVHRLEAVDPGEMDKTMARVDSETDREREMEK